MSVLLKSITIPLLLAIALIGGLAAWTIVWFLLPELRPAMGNCVKSMLSRIRRRAVV